MTGYCKEHGAVDGVVDSRGRERCGVPTCRKLISHNQQPSEQDSRSEDHGQRESGAGLVPWKEAFQRGDLRVRRTICFEHLQEITSIAANADMPSQDQYHLSRASE